jgi:16S rRNA (cytosine1402-N4)-methyltransferase
MEHKLFHIPVLIKESIFFLNCSSGKTIVDCTLGGGGHSREIIKTLLPDGRLISIDRDREAIEAFSDFAGGFPSNITLVKGNFSDLDKILLSSEIKEVDGILFDLGVSMYQLKDEKRGFSLQSDSPLDMRMDREMPGTAADIVNNFPEKELADIIYNYGDETRSRRIAREIVCQRKISRILTTGQLCHIVSRANPGRGRKIHPATRTFMALRIFLNKELEALKEGLRKALHFLKPGGRMVVISFHSLEDRIVKNFFRDSSRGITCELTSGNPLVKLINKKPVYPGEEEKSLNPSSRSAHLRAVEKI